MNQDQVCEFHEHDYYSVRELAEQLSVTPATVGLWRVAGKIPASAVTKFRARFAHSPNKRNTNLTRSKKK